MTPPPCFISYQTGLENGGGGVEGGSKCRRNFLQVSLLAFATPAPPSLPGGIILLKLRPAQMFCTTISLLHMFASGLPSPPAHAILQSYSWYTVCCSKFWASCLSVSVEPVPLF